MFWHRAFLSAGFIAALSISTAAAAPNPAATTKSAGTASSSRTWTVTGGKYAGQLKGKLLTVKNCEVTLTVNEQQSVTDITYQRNSPTRKKRGTAASQSATTKPVPITHTEDYTETIRVPLKLLSKKDRQWLEKDYASECAVSKKSIIGDIGVFATKDGSFYVDKKIDSKTAVIALVVDTETKWKFVLKSHIVNAMEEDPEHAGKGADALAQQDKLDFVLKEKKTYDDVQFPVFTETD